MVVQTVADVVLASGVVEMDVPYRHDIAANADSFILTCMIFNNCLGHSACNLR